MISSMLGLFSEGVAPRENDLVSELLRLIRSGRTEDAITIMNTNSLDYSSVHGELGISPLHIASQVGDLHVVAELLCRKVNVDEISTFQKYTALHVASKFNRKYIVDLLLKSGASTSIKDEDGKIPLDLCEADSVKELLVTATKVTQRTESVSTPEIAPSSARVIQEITIEAEVKTQTTDPKLSITPLMISTSTANEIQNARTNQEEGNQHQQQSIEESDEEGTDRSDLSSGRILKSTASSPYTKHDIPLLDFSKLTPSNTNTTKKKQQPSSDIPPPPPIDDTFTTARLPPPRRQHFFGSPEEEVSTPSYQRSDLSIDHNYYDEDQELSEAVLQAAKDTSVAFLEDNLPHGKLMNQLWAWANSTLATSHQQIQNVLKTRPDLIHARGKGRVMDARADLPGQTLLHHAATNNKLGLLELLLEINGVSAWSRDLQGRTPLHCAAENLDADDAKFEHKKHIVDGVEVCTDKCERCEKIEINYNVCNLLKKKMLEEFPNRDPVGINAPLDLAGRTPLGRQRRIQNISPSPSVKLQKLLFSKGDRSVLPLSPVNRRTGKSPSKHTDSGISGENIIYAFSEASGWNSYMEDRVLISCPFIEKFAWSMFGILDGHGGSFCSNYLSKNLAEIFGEIVDAKISNGEINSNATPQQLRELLEEGCDAAEEKLRLHERMSVYLEKDKIDPMKVIYAENGQPKKVLEKEMLDASGTTLSICIVTNKCYAICNIGDSRAVVAKFDWQKDIVYSKWASIDHKGDTAEEKERVEKAGGTIDNGGVKFEGFAHRLGMTRTLGDFAFKQNHLLPRYEQLVVPKPDVTVFDKNLDDQFVVIASDGVYDLMTSSEVVTFFSERLTLPTDCMTEEENSSDSTRSSGISNRDARTQERAASACDELLEECLRRGSADNMSVVVVIFGDTTSSTARSGKGFSEDGDEAALVSKQLFEGKH